MEPIEGDCVPENFTVEDGSYANLWKYTLITKCVTYFAFVGNFQCQKIFNVRTLLHIDKNHLIK